MKQEKAAFASNIVVMPAQVSDMPEIIAMFLEDGQNPYGWGQEKYEHYYHDYSEGAPVSLVAKHQGKIVGHYGLLPVKIGCKGKQWLALLGLHTYVSHAHRGRKILSLLFEAVEKNCQSRGAVAFLVFGNLNITRMYERYGCKTVAWLGFGKNFAYSASDDEMERFRFIYSSAWYGWRFGKKRNIYVSRYVDSSGMIRKQLLKCSPDFSGFEWSKLESCEVWAPNEMFCEEQFGRFCQPFTVKAFSEEVIKEGIYETGKWCLDMGDSDTFQYVPWESE
ncbi:MAG: GNAT family N-acetyltransferase [Zoogloeaceae bacterium]|nr:GNAT family N-acetyltransferase [Zoogloeaceae bacterium]